MKAVKDEGEIVLLFGIVNLVKHRISHLNTLKRSLKTQRWRERERLGINDKSVWDCTLVANAKDKKHLISQPIYKWERSDVWNFIHDRNMKINPLYDMGFERVGCVGCPLGGRKSMLKEFEMFPKYKECYIRAFDKMLEERRKAGKDDVTNNEGWHRWETGKDVFDWWICEGSVNVKGQLSLFDNESEV